MYCNKCGKEVEEREKFCKYCGAPLECESAPAPKKKKGKWPWIVLVLLLVAIGIGVGIWFSMNNNSNAELDDQDDWTVVQDKESQTRDTEETQATERDMSTEATTEKRSGNRVEQSTQSAQNEQSNVDTEKVDVPEISMKDIEDVSASSYLSETNIKHVPDRIMDDDVTTAWVEGVDGNGEGESVTFTFGDSYSVSGIRIWNGYQKSEDLYYKNARPSELELEFSDGATERISLQDRSDGAQRFEFAPHVTSYVKIKILSVYSGNKYEDTVISEVELF